MELSAKEVSLIAVLSALNLAIASLNRYTPRIGFGIGGISIGHLLVDAIFCTCIFVLAVFISRRLGIASLIGLVTGLGMVVFGAKIIAVATWLTRGFVFDLVFFATKHRACCMRCSASAAFLAFFSQTVLGKTLSVALFTTPSAQTPVFTAVVALALVGSAFSVGGAYIALKIGSRVKGVWGL